ncbi:MAG: hypothetical protein COV44_00785 [Deltaproteobacteria bacterium CG11_big_fil_rev_8_21_14_0_20_45_16]|nr:MAG: hypothetical protein COV44_00785 [Deltaproteobacteria bacterium CG11_big_fil_rev_8_21_14_0_20_45_16]
MNSNKSTALRIENLSVVYNPGADEKLAVDSLSLAIEQGEFFALLGPNGAGKTSVISSIAGLLNVERGSIEVFDSETATKSAKALIGLVPQEPVHHGFFTVNQVLKFQSGYHGLWRNQERINYLLENLQLVKEKNKKVGQLSGGMKRRLGIAKALVHSPKVLLLDEPSAGVDIELRASLWEFMKKLNKEGMTILLTTHYLEEAQRLCNRIAIMNEGRLISVDATQELLLMMTERQISILLRSGFAWDISLMEAKPPGVVSLRKEGSSIELSMSGRCNLRDLLENLSLKIEDVVDIQMKEGPLEHAFLKIVEKDRADSVKKQLR